MGKESHTAPNWNKPNIDRALGGDGNDYSCMEKLHIGALQVEVSLKVSLKLSWLQDHKVYKKELAAQTKSAKKLWQKDAAVVEDTGKREMWGVE